MPGASSGRVHLPRDRARTGHVDLLADRLFGPAARPDQLGWPPELPRSPDRRPDLPDPGAPGHGDLLAAGHGGAERSGRPHRMAAELAAARPDHRPRSGLPAGGAWGDRRWPDLVRAAHPAARA